MSEGIDLYQVWGQDAHVLAAVGRCLFTQPTRVSVRLSRSLAEQAVAAWERPPEELDPAVLSSETAEQRMARHFAGALGLIGLAIQEGGLWEGDEVVVGLDAWQIGDALRAADEAGLLDGLSPPNY